MNYNAYLSISGEHMTFTMNPSELHLRLRRGSHT